MNTFVSRTLPELPPYDHEPRSYDGPTFGEVRDLRNRYLS